MIIKNIYTVLYGWPAVVFVVLSTLGTAALGIALCRWQSKLLRILILTAMLCMLVYVTVIVRLPSGTESGVLIWNPIESLKCGLDNAEIFRVALGNIIMFIPIGGCLAGCYCKYSMRLRFIITLTVGLTISSIIEGIQYFMHVGQAETIDLICNLMGVLIGAILFLFGNKVGKRKISIQV